MIGAVIGVALGAWLFRAMPENVLLAMLGIFILVMVWVPKPKIPGLDRAGMVLGGGISSVLTMFVGATGPFIQSLLVPLGLDRKQIVATQAVMMTAQHALKVVAFGFIGIALVPWLPLIAAMVVSGFVGTVMGTKLLDRMSERFFQITLKIVLTIVALDLLRRAAGSRSPECNYPQRVFSHWRKARMAARFCSSVSAPEKPRAPRGTRAWPERQNSRPARGRLHRLGHRG